MAAGLASAAGIVGYRIPGDLPPTHGHLLRMGDTLTYAAQRALLSGRSLVREYTLADISSFPAVGTIDPLTHKNSAVVDAYRDARAKGFDAWRLQVEGQVATPREFSLADLRQLQARTQIIRHTCEKGDRRSASGLVFWRARVSGWWSARATRTGAVCIGALLPSRCAHRLSLALRPLDDRVSAGRRNAWS